ncbi:SPOUT methyltransferase [Campylobacter lari]|uniref:23S rRNA (pseudouridine(1915)-N(3))-methyltransferase RlmH n=1 Tax=Campylobacter lari TaxID=201 RepID=UPI001279D765|nr:23S rRNA (pseudouridine(1915)-N(3))-methyltransferase RlmH [Campylobacter lari]EAI4298336.1 23S rRNA (pseudouridine(1915)-N(3))-methyltransferase RlmH [Campylobacter lari]EAK0446171.1 23S rRNA (pseudouridine(1915)-N(3))-methyltransferase RlmH [Campylobacter lari]ECK1948070.1 23S rRNA (pseudouridine(1915)-N(3))-methyltransferase RlmH [Campylobacter lari]MBT0759346.1 23S rRNA (pseudouridine(1915)-N(3))-methyltransferase RlmH [Campylobacter lari]MBT0819017.1 23S rRNA (pseudouridine(1915)-N(3))
MQINLLSIQKNNNDEFSKIDEHYIKLVKKFCSFNDICVFNNKINQAQNANAIEAKKSYTNALSPYKKGFCIALDEKGKEFTSVEFAKLLQDKNEISFFIGGAYGFEQEFIAQMHTSIALSKMTLVHKFAKTMLLEQIYRAFCINTNHPYHK